VKLLEKHSGPLLIAGAVCLKLGAMTSSLLLAAPGYIVLGAVVCYKLKTWRDHDDREN